MKIRWGSLNRKIHHWGSIICTLPILIVIITGLLLTFKKQSDWIQPSTAKSISSSPTISFDSILDIAKNADKVEINDWSDIDRLDIRPSKGIVKIRAKNRWEIQIDSQTGNVIKLAYRRSDLIESIHTGKFFNDYVAFGLFFPASVILLILWITGLYLFITITINKNKNKKRKLQFSN
jgi:uncharacterized iron-regulated membrane protein